MRHVRGFSTSNLVECPGNILNAEALDQHGQQREAERPAEMHANISEMYVSDPRFAKTYEDMAPGLAQYVRDAVHANAARQ